MLSIILYNLMLADVLCWLNKIVISSQQTLSPLQLNQVIKLISVDQLWLSFISDPLVLTNNH